MADLFARGLFPVTNEDIAEAHATFDDQFISKFDQLNFVEILPEDVCDKIFLLLDSEDAIACCQVSTGWRNVINNDLHWLARCKRHGWADDDVNPQKWDKLVSHVPPGMSGKTRKGLPLPDWSFPALASSQVKPCCPWGRYFRQYMHVRRNWRNGRSITHTLWSSDEYDPRERYVATDCNGTFLAIGTSEGVVHVWKITGVPKHMHKYTPARKKTEVEEIRMTQTHLAVLYQNGLFRVYLLPKLKLPESTSRVKFELLLENRVCGLPVNMHEYTLFTQEDRDRAIQEPQGPNRTQESNNNNLEGWLPELFRSDPWFDTANEYEASQMSFFLTDHLLIITGFSCNCFLVWELSTKKMKKVMYPTGVRGGRQVFWNNEIMYLGARRRIPQQIGSVLTIIIYKLNEPFDFTEIRANNITEEIRIHPFDNDRLVWRSIDSMVTAMKISTQEYIFTKPASCIDNLVVHGPYIIYHEHDGPIIALDWYGNVLYERPTYSGRLELMSCYNDYLICGGENKELTICDVHTGKKINIFRNQSARIRKYFVHDTNIIAVSAFPPATMIGFW